MRQQENDKTDPNTVSVASMYVRDNKKRKEEDKLEGRSIPVAFSTFVGAFHVKEGEATMAGMTGELHCPRVHGGRLCESQAALEERAGSRVGMQGFRCVRDPGQWKGAAKPHCLSDPVCSRVPAMEAQTDARTTPRVKATTGGVLRDCAGTALATAPRRGEPSGCR